MRDARVLFVTLQTVSASLPIALPGVRPGLTNLCLADTVFATPPTYTSLNGYSGGGAVMVPVQGAPTALSTWQITGWSVSLQGWIYTANLGTNSTSWLAGGNTSTVSLSALGLFGLLGQVWAGIIPASTQGPTTSQEPLSFAPTPAQPVPWVPYSTIPLPENGSTVSMIWDGATDDFPTFSNTAPPNIGAKPLTFSSQLAAPIQVQPGQQVSFGLWLTPSNLFGCALPAGLNGLVTLTNAQYSYTYDDTPPKPLPITTA